MHGRYVEPNVQTRTSERWANGRDLALGRPKCHPCGGAISEENHPGEGQEGANLETSSKSDPLQGGGCSRV